MCGLMYSILFHVASKAELKKMDMKIEAQMAKLVEKIDKDLEAHSIVISQTAVWSIVNEKLLEAQLRKK